MNKRKGLGTLGAGLGVRLVTLLIILLLFPSCSPSNKADEELCGEIKDLKKEVKALGEKLDKLEVSQQALLLVLKKPAAAPPEAAATPPPPPPQFQAPAVPPPLTVSQLIAGKDQYLGARVTVKGEAGPVIVNHKSHADHADAGRHVQAEHPPDQPELRRLVRIVEMDVMLRDH